MPALTKSSGQLPENGIHQTRKPRIQFRAPQGVLMHGARDARLHETGLPQYAEVVRDAGLGAPAIKLPAGGLFDLRQMLDDFKAKRIAQGMKNPL